MVEWRNGRRNGLKIRCQRWREGSSPSSTTNLKREVSVTGSTDGLIIRVP